MSLDGQQLLRCSCCNTSSIRPPTATSAFWPRRLRAGLHPRACGKEAADSAPKGSSPSILPDPPAAIEGDDGVWALYSRRKPRWSNCPTGFPVLESFNTMMFHRGDCAK